MMEDTLRELGLGDKEIAVYSTVLEYGKLSPARISAITGINRTTTYAVGKELIQKGFLNEDLLKGVTYYYPSSPRELIKVAKRERQAFVQRELTIEELAKTIQEMPRSKTYAVPKIKFIEHEDKVEKFLYENSAKWTEGLEQRGTTWYGFQDHAFVESDTYRKWIDWYWKGVPETIDLKLLSNDAEIEKKIGQRYPRRNIKFWKKDINFTATQWIVGDYSIMIQNKENPHYLVEMHDAVYAQNMRELFKNLWEEVK